MPHFPKPYFRKDRKVSVVQVQGRQHNLGCDENAAWQQYHELMAEFGRNSAVGPVVGATLGEAHTVPPSPLVSDIIQRFVAFCRANCAAATAK